MSSETRITETCSNQVVSYWQDKYERLLHAFDDVQRNNQLLEDRLLKVVDKTESEKLCLSQEIDDLAHKLQTALQNVRQLETESARYKSDCMLAVHLLQCQPSGYHVAPSFEGLPDTVKSAMQNGSLRKVASSSLLESPRKQCLLQSCSLNYVVYMLMHCNEASLQYNLQDSVYNRDMSTLIQVPSFPPTAMVYFHHDEPASQELSREDYDLPRANSSDQMLKINNNNSVSDHHIITLEQDPELEPSLDKSELPCIRTAFMAEFSTSPEYRSVEMRQCQKCGNAVQTTSVACQTTSAATSNLTSFMGLGTEPEDLIEFDADSRRIKRNCETCNGGVIGYQARVHRKSSAERTISETSVASDDTNY